MKVTVITERSSPFSEHAKTVMIRLSREMDIDYEIYEVEKGEMPVIVQGREMPCFLIGEKVIWEGKPNYEELKKAIKHGKPGLGERLIRSIWGRK